MGRLVGFDVGTTSLKAVVYDVERGDVVGVGSRRTPTYHPRPEWSEFDAEEIWGELCAALREALAQAGPGEVAAVGVASMGEAGVVLDANGRVRTPAIAWYCPRTEPQSREWEATLGRARLFAITGQLVEAKFSAHKIRWLRQHLPEAFAPGWRWLCMPDFVLWKLTGAFATDYSIASRTLLFDQRRRDWSDELLDHAAIPRYALPALHLSGTAVGRVTKAAAERTGLPAGIPAATGGHDHLCAALAVGMTDPGRFVESMGTAGGILALRTSFEPDPALLEGGYCCYHYVAAGRYVVCAYINSAGGQIEWLVSRFWPELPREAAFGAALRAAEAVPPGVLGLACFPALNGQGSPGYDERQRMAWFGVQAAHGREHFARALLEALACWHRENVLELERLTGVRCREVIGVGGASSASIWRRLAADIGEVPLRVPRLREAAGVGAALLAGVGAGLFRSVQEAAASVRAAAEVEHPDPTHAAYYRAYYETVYRQLAAAVRPVQEALRRLPRVG